MRDVLAMSEEGGLGEEWGAVEDAGVMTRGKGDGVAGNELLLSLSLSDVESLKDRMDASRLCWHGRYM